MVTVREGMMMRPQLLAMICGYEGTGFQISMSVMMMTYH